MIYHGHPTFEGVEYCCPLWHPMKISDILELESVHKTSIFRIAGMRDILGGGGAMAKNGEKWRKMAMANSPFSFVKFAIFRQFLILEFHI